MRFTWKGPSKISAYPSNTAPDLLAPGPYPTKEQNPPTTVTKKVLITIPRTDASPGTAYYDPVTKGVMFGSMECTSVGTSLPTVCTKKLSRPLKIWRKRLNAENGITTSKVTLNQLQGTSVTITDEPIRQCAQSDITSIKDCHVRKNGVCTAIRRSAGSFTSNYCSTTREYLQKRCKTYDQNQLQGKKLEEYTFTSGEGSESPSVTGICNKIIIKPSNNSFKVQGGVSSSSRTNRLKYDTVMSNVQLKNYATARATIDGGYVNIKGQNKPQPAGFIRARQDRPHVTCNSV